MTNISYWNYPGKKYCVFFGAGFSKWACGLSLAKDLFDFDIKIWGQKERKKIEKVREIKEYWDKKNRGKYSEEFIGELMESSPDEKKIILWYVVRRLADPFILNPFSYRRSVLSIDDKRKYSFEGVRKAKNFIDSVNTSNLNGILTTNYDLLIEYTLGTENFNYGTRYEMLHGRGKYPLTTWLTGPVLAQGELTLLKLHGSISLTEKGYCTDGRGGITGKALIIPPTRNKQIPAIIAPVWDHAKTILKNSETIIFFGFAFNPYDQNILNLFKETVPWIKTIILINPNLNVMQSARNIWPSARIERIDPNEINGISQLL